MLQTLDARLAQARAGELGHLEFLQVLCHDEISRRETIAIARRLRRARFDQQATLEEFDFAASPKLPAAQIRDLAALRWLHAGESVILYGPVGVTPCAFPSYGVCVEQSSLFSFTWYAVALRRPRLTSTACRSPRWTLCSTVCGRVQAAAASSERGPAVGGIG